MATRAQISAYIQTYRLDVYNWIIANFTTSQINGYLSKARVAIHADALTSWNDYLGDRTEARRQVHEVLLCIGWAINRVL